MRMSDWSSDMCSSDLVERLRPAFRRDIQVPVRHHHDVAVGDSTATLLLMPAWQVDRHIGVKMVTVFPANAEHSLPAVMGIYVLIDGQNGSTLALLAGPTLPVERTAGAAALASPYLPRPDYDRHPTVGTG